MPLKENLVNYMKNKKIQIKELSVGTGISEATLKRLRTHTDANTTLDVLIKLATSLNISVNDLIQEEKSTPTFYQNQDNAFDIESGLAEFIVVFTKNTFSFKPGSKAIFKKYLPETSITKYIVNKQGKLFERVDGNKWLFRDEKNNNYSIDENFISAIILKELYEVNYV